MKILRLKISTLFTLCCGLLIAFTGCKNIDPAEESFPITPLENVSLDIRPSTLNIPVTYSIEALETYLNEKLKGDFLKTIIRPENKDKLEIGLSMSKTGKINLKSNSKEIICTVPIKAVATVLNSGMNILTKGIKPVETELIIQLRSPASLDSDWNLVTRFELVQIKWIVPPKVKVMGINFDLKKSIEKLLTEDEEMLTTLLDTEINNGVSLEKDVGKVWDDLQKPIQVSKDKPYVYLKFICDSISGRFFLSDTAITCLTSIVAKVGLITDTTGKASNRKKLPPFVNNYSTDSLSDVYLHLIVGMEGLNNELSTHLVGHTFSTGALSLTIQEIEVVGSDLGMIIKLKTTGAVDGELIATATPFFDSTNQNLSFKEFEFNVMSNSVLLQLAYVFLHNMIRDSIENGLKLELNSVLDSVPQIIHKALAKGKVGKTIDINVSDMRIAGCNIVLDSEYIHLNVHTYFLAGINLKHINPGKSLRIRPKNKSSPSGERK